MTYSIVARDPDSGELGVAVQSHWFSVGSVVTWARAGVGVVATQAFANTSYGPLGLDLMAGGAPAPDALRALLAVDEAAARRQVAMVDTSGRADVHTGDACIAQAGHVTGDGFSVQANMMLEATVPDAMAAAFTASDGPLPSRLLDALDAGEAEGGDIRGRQSAALLVVRGERAPAHAERVVELRVEDHVEPLVELRRLYDVHRAYARMNDGDERLASGDVDGASREYEAARASAPGNAEFDFWQAVLLVGAERYDHAREVLERCRAAPGEWDELLRRLEPLGLIPQGAAARILDGQQGSA